MVRIGLVVVKQDSPTIVGFPNLLCRTQKAHIHHPTPKHNPYIHTCFPVRPFQYSSSRSALEDCSTELSADQSTLVRVAL
jgi:hypothetical protein